MFWQDARVARRPRTVWICVLKNETTINPSGPSQLSPPSPTPLTLPKLLSPSPIPPAVPNSSRPSPTSLPPADCLCVRWISTGRVSSGGMPSSRGCEALFRFSRRRPRGGASKALPRLRLRRRGSSGRFPRRNMIRSGFPLW